ncbi:MAG TPA: hypothetical protein VKH20_03610 [Solirubrobacterales bacterium]|nr:hypothetical protein [Solirubrobacterales bacterium]
MRLTRRQLLFLSGFATVAFWVVLFAIDQQLTNTGGPSILGLEFAGSAGQVDQIASEWGSHGVNLARLSLWLDFGFMVSYGTFFALVGLATRDLARSRELRLLSVAGLAVPYFAVGAAIFDACENSIWLLALGGRATGLAPIATGCAVAKFALITVAEVYAVCGLVAWLRFLRPSESR